MASCSFYMPAFQELRKLLEITLAKHNPNMEKERRDLRSALQEERAAGLAHTATRQDGSSGVSAQVHLKTLTFVQIFLFVSVLK